MTKWTQDPVLTSGHRMLLVLSTFKLPGQYGGCSFSTTAIVDSPWRLFKIRNNEANLSCNSCYYIIRISYTVNATFRTTYNVLRAETLMMLLLSFCKIWFYKNFSGRLFRALSFMAAGSLWAVNVYYMVFPAFLFWQGTISLSEL